MSAQLNNTECATPDPTTSDPEGVYSYSIAPEALNYCEPIVFNIKFWGINRPNGQNDFPNRAHDVLEGVANLNILYNQFGIYFKYRGFEEIDSPVVIINHIPDPNGYYILESTSQYGAMVDWAAGEGYKDENAFNVYLFGWANGFGGMASYRSLTAGVKSSEFTSHLLAHEIGHNLFLFHTNSPSENATRDPNNSCFNATTAGDKVVDTNAHNGLNATNTNPITCKYTGNETDNCPGNNTLYTITHEDVINAMKSSDNGLGCKEN